MDATAQLALLTKLKNIFEDATHPDLFLSFPVLTPLGFKPEDLDFDSAPSKPEVLNARIDYSRWVNKLPDQDIFDVSGPDYLWHCYDGWLNAMALAKDQASADERAQYQQAMSVLTVTDGDGLRTDSPAVLLYKQYRDAVYRAQQEYNNAKLTAAASTDAGQQAQWHDIDEPRLRGAIVAAQSDWDIKGGKAEIESAQATVTQHSGQLPQTVWADWRKNFSPDIDTLTDPASNETYAPSAFSPSDLVSQPWISFRLDAGEVARLVGLAPPSLKTALAETDAATKVKSISFQFRSAAVVRPWFRPEIFASRFWKFHDGTGPLSDGQNPPQGSWPAYATAVVFARNIVVEMQDAPPQRLQHFPIFALNASALQAVQTRRAYRGELTNIRQPAGASPRFAMTARTAFAVRSVPGTAEVMTMGPARSVLTSSTAESPPVAAAPAAAQQANLARNMLRLNRAVFRAAPAGASTGPAPAPADPVPDETISLLAFICKRIPKCPDPDPALPW